MTTGFRLVSLCILLRLKCANTRIACVFSLLSKIWPTYLPRPLGVPIDHIFVSKSHWHTAGSTVADVSGTDHRAVLTRLTYSEM